MRKTVEQHAARFTDVFVALTPISGVQDVVSVLLGKRVAIDPNRPEDSSL